MESPKSAYPLIAAIRKTGHETFTESGKSTGIHLLDFWRWSVSDLLSNVTRGRLAEFIVASALGINGGVRNEWDAFDLMTKAGIRIEVKSSAYLQSWAHRALSPIKFTVGTTRKWENDTGLSAMTSERQADVYVFCVLHHQEKESVDPLNLNQWEFYVLSTKVLNEKVSHQKSISLTSLLMLGPTKTDFHGLKSVVDAITLDSK